MPGINLHFVADWQCSTLNDNSWDMELKNTGAIAPNAFYWSVLEIVHLWFQADRVRLTGPDNMVPLEQWSSNSYTSPEEGMKCQALDAPRVLNSLSAEHENYQQ